MFELNGTYWIFIISFLLFMKAFDAIVLKPVGKTLEERDKKIEADNAASKAARAHAEQLQVSYEEDLRRIRTEAQSEIMKAVEGGNKQRAATLALVAQDGQKQLDEARAALSKEREGLIDALVAQEKELVETITRKVLGDETVSVSIDASQVRRTLEESR